MNKETKDLVSKFTRWDDTLNRDGRWDRISIIPEIRSCIGNLINASDSENMERFVDQDTYGETRSEKVREFLIDVLKVCKMHGLSVSHEDFHGGFEVEKWRDDNAEWFGAAADRTD